MKNKTQNAFTLIELLIVVAIIGILAAIAVPNFLSAQIRAKIARNEADMRSIATALAAYQVDNNAYPFPADPLGNVLNESSSLNWFETHASPQLTTPVSYMSTLPIDPFQEKQFADEVTTYHYMTRDYSKKTTGGTTAFEEYIKLLSANPSGVDYLLLGHGPDGDHDAPGEGVPDIYMPSNGVASNGDVLFFGPGSGFHR